MIKNYVNKMLNKKYNYYNILFYTALIFIVKKFNKKLCICVNYKTLNVLTIKNYNAFSLIKKILNWLYLVKLFIKFKIIAVFNKIQIKIKNKNKNAFFIKYKLFKYIIILFNLCNISSMFQSLINKVLKKILNNFYFVYFNNILIYSYNFKKHIKHVSQIFKYFLKTDLYLNINKCDFYITEV